MTAPSQQRKRPSLTTLIVFGLAAGAAVGLFFGETIAPIKWVGDGYVGLLQMAVLPYIALSLVNDIGRLSSGAGVRLMRISLAVLLGLWVIGLASLLIMTQAFPRWESGSFFSSRFTDEPPSPNWLDLFIPSNPFRSFADNSIPAVVVFCIGIGIALMGRPDKAKLLDPMAVMVDALAGLNKLVVQLTPIGMFAIAAYTAGTIDPAEFSLIQGYLLTYGISAILVSLVILPTVVASITPLRFGEVLRASRNPMIAAFVIGNSFVVLPLIIDAIKQIETDRVSTTDSELRQSEYLVPLAYPFPDIGRIIGLIFLPFAAWFFGSVVDPQTMPAIVSVGFLGSFAKPIVTIPLLLNIAELPSDIFNLYLASGIVAARFGDLMKTMHLIAFSMLTISFLNGTAHLRPIRLICSLTGSILLLWSAAAGINGYLTKEFQDRYSKEQLVTHRDMRFPENSRVAGVRTEILSTSQPNPVPLGQSESRVQRIREHGKIRIGFDPGKMPFCYYRADTDVLIGFDVQMAYYLADDLQVDIEFVPIDNEILHQQLADDHFDVAMSAVEGSVENAALIPSIDSYMDVTLAVVVRDFDKTAFRDVDEILESPNLRLAVVKKSFFAERADKVLPRNVEVVELDSASEFFENFQGDLRGLVISAESGSAWTLRYPRFTVANPLEGRVRVPLYYMTSDDLAFETFLQNWLALKRADGTYQQLYEYWILGLDEESHQPRWCILRDVLGWIE